MNKRNIVRYLSNVLGWRTKRRIVVIESDDWGSIRFPNKETVDVFKKNGYNVDKCGFSRFDCLETNEDLNQLINLLTSIENRFEKKICITMLCNTSNPNFELIQKSQFEKYYGEVVSETIYKDQERDQIVELLKKGSEIGCFDLQYHGGEHLQISRWMQTLREGQPDTIFAFNNKVCGHSPRYMPNLKQSFRATYDIDDIEDLLYQKKRIVEGIFEFRKLYGFHASYFVAPNGPLHKDLEISLKQNQVKFIGMPKVQKMPLGKDAFKRRFHWMGKHLDSGLCVITRNVIFEPMSAEYGNIENVLNDMRTAFSLKKPVVLSTHRANYVGGIDVNNRINGLNKLEILLTAIIKTWPDVEFISSSDLGTVIKSRRS